MDLKDFTNCSLSLRAYGGAAGRKLGILLDGENYILKFPGNLKEQNMKNVRLSYSNGPISEYIGSHIYESIGIPVHETILGRYGEKIVVACKDFVQKNQTLYEFEKLKVTFLPHFLDSNGNETNGTGADLQEILMTIREHPLLKKIPGAENHFWQMFIVDALIGNPDRNNGNWGVILQENDEISLAPVYDNGNCLNNKWDEVKMQETLTDPSRFAAEAYRGRTCIFELNGKAVNPYKLIASCQYPGCCHALQEIVPNINMETIADLLEPIPIHDVMKKFYWMIMKERYDSVLLPALNKVLCTEQELYSR